MVNSCIVGVSLIKKTLSHDWEELVTLILATISQCWERESPFVQMFDAKAAKDEKVEQTSLFASEHAKGSLVTIVVNFGYKLATW